MAGHGGRRLRAGRKPDPLSARSLERRGALTLLPAEGYRGPVPDFPLPDATSRELEVWAETWRAPQAEMWAQEPWRHRSVAMFVRYSVRIEDPNATASLGNVAMRLADQIGMTPASMLELGWAIADLDSTGRERPLQSVPSQRRDRPGFTVARTGVPVPALERARQRAEGRDPRDHLHDGE